MSHTTISQQQIKRTEILVTSSGRFPSRDLSGKRRKALMSLLRTAKVPGQ
jgi:hypothetical protein